MFLQNGSAWDERQEPLLSRIDLMDDIWRLGFGRSAQELHNLLLGPGLVWMEWHLLELRCLGRGILIQFFFKDLLVFFSTRFHPFCHTTLLG